MSFFGDTSVQQPAEKRKLANISDDAINSNQQAVPVKYLAGRAYVAGDYISPAYNPQSKPIQTKTGKDSTSTTGYKYFADFALMFCLGPVDAIYTIVVDNEIAWTGNIVRGNANKVVITLPQFGVIHLYWGTETQGIDNILLMPRAAGASNQQDSTTWDPNDGPNQVNGFAAGDPNPYSGHYDKHPGYRGQCYAVFKNWKLGRDRTNVQNIQFELKRGCFWFGGARKLSDDKGVNPIACMFEAFTDSRFGMELPEANLNQTLWEAEFAAQEAQNARLSVTQTQQTKFRQFVAELLEYFDGWIRRNGTQIEIGHFVHGNPPSSATLTDDDLLGDPELEPQGWGPTLNEVTVVYSDRDHHFNTYPQRANDPNNRRITGSPRPITLERPWLTDAALAKKYANEYLKIKAMPFTAGQLHVKREWITTNNMLPGKIFTYTSGFYDLSIRMRLLEIEHEGDNSSKATLTVEWERGVWPSLYVPPPFQGPGGFVLGPRAIWKSRITEVPYLMQDHRFATQIVPLAVKGNVEVVGFNVWVSFDAGITYTKIRISRGWSTYGRNSLDMVPGTLNIWCSLYGPHLDEIVVSQSAAEQNDDTLLLVMNAEVMSIGTVTAFNSGVFLINVLRHRYGTTAQTHTANTDMFIIRRDELLLCDNAQFVPGQSIKIKLQPFTEHEDYDLASITPITYVISGWNDITPPIISPPGGTFVNSIHVRAIGHFGETIRYATDGAPVDSADPKFPAGGRDFHTTVTIRVRSFTQDGRYSAERIVTFTKVPAGTEAQPLACSPPHSSFSGVRGHLAGDLTLLETTGGSTVKFQKNNGAIQTYSTPIHLNCNQTGDVCEFWAEKPGLDDSNHVVFDNTKIHLEGGGHFPNQDPFGPGLPMNPV